MQVIRCDRCGAEGTTTQSAMLRGARLDLCEPCTDAVIGDRAEWKQPPPEQGQSVTPGRFTRPPVHGVAAADMDPDMAERIRAQ